MTFRQKGQGDNMLGRISLSIAVAAASAAGCAASYPPPTQRMAEALATVRGAQEVGANDNPQGQLHLRLAQEELQNANILVTQGDNKRADFVLVRAKSDADLALAEAREWAARSAAQASLQQVAVLRSAATNAQPPNAVEPATTPPPPMRPMTAPSTPIPPTNGGSK
jgi:hypothetical protein